MDPHNRLKAMRKVRADLQDDTIILISTFEDFAVGEARGSGSLLAVRGAVPASLQGCRYVQALQGGRCV